MFESLASVNAVHLKGAVLNYLAAQAFLKIGFDT